MSVFKRDSIVDSCPAWDEVQRAPITSTIDGAQGAINLTANENLILKGTMHRYYINSCVSYALENNKDPIRSYERAIANGHETHWISQHCTVITSHEQDRVTYVQVEIGQRVFFEGRLFEIGSAPNDNLRLIPVTE